MANDVVLEWLIAAVSSVRAKGCTLPICIIPYDERIERTRAFAKRVGSEILNPDAFAEWDALAREFVQGSTRNMFRKFACFGGVFENFMYADVDIVALMNWDEILQSYIGHENEFWYFGLSRDEVYKPGAFLNELRARGRGNCFNAGGFVASRDVLSSERVHALAREARGHIADLIPENGDQSFLNYCIDHIDNPVRPTADVIPNLYDWNWAASEYLGRKDFFTIADEAGVFGGKRFPFVHWAGFSLRSYMPQRELFVKYRLRDAPLTDKLYYLWAWRVRPFFGNIIRRITKPLRAQSQ